jgi:DNA polymerase-1
MQVEVFDLETDGFVDGMTTIWSCGIADPKDGIVTTYTDYDDNYPSLAEGLERLRRADRVVAHNLIGFDYWALHKLYPDVITFEKCWDSMIVAQLLDPERRSHAIKSYGVEMGFPKGDFTNFMMEPVEGQTRAETFVEMFEYMERDVEINVRIYNRLQIQMKEDLVWGTIDVDWRRAVDLEHKTNWGLALQGQHGFRLDLDKARDLEGVLREEAIMLEREMQNTFPPAIIPAKGNWAYQEHRWANVGTKTPKVGNRTTGTVKGAPYTKVTIQQFNASSRPQIVHRLTSKYPQWKPSVFTTSGLVKIDDKVLANLRVPEAKSLARYFRVNKQLSQLVDGKNGWLKLEKYGRVHGRVKSVGCRTHRMSHFYPNMAQVDKKDTRMREVWVPDHGHKLVGVDASGLELRMLAHYLAIWDGGAYGDTVIKGRNEDKTDVHSRTQAIAGLYSRNSAKSLIYAFLYGAGNQKLAEVSAIDAKEAGEKPMAINHPNGKKIRDKLMRGITGLENLIAVSQERDKRQKWLRGLDGRKIATNGQHSALNTLLQGAGAIVMKQALVEFHFEVMPKLGLVDENYMPVGWNYCANVHDEVQMSSKPEIAEQVGKAFEEAIRQAGRTLNLRCPLDGEAMVGDSWADTH